MSSPSTPIQLERASTHTHASTAPSPAPQHKPLEGGYPKSALIQAGTGVIPQRTRTRAESESEDGSEFHQRAHGPIRWSRHWPFFRPRRAVAPESISRVRRGVLVSLGAGALFAVAVGLGMLLQRMRDARLGA